MRCKNEYANEETYRAAKRRQSERYRARTGSGLVSIPGYDPSMDALAALSKSNKERSDSQHE